jgi:hypothetical protein
MGSGVASPALLVPVRENSAPPLRRDNGSVQVVPAVHVEEDVQMEDGDVSFPPLPTPAPPVAEAIWAPHFQWGANWMPVPIPRGAPAVRGSLFGRPMPRYAGLIIASMEELEQHLEVVNMLRNELVVAHMRAYVREANMTAKESCWQSGRSLHGCCLKLGHPREWESHCSHRGEYAQAYRLPRGVGTLVVEVPKGSVYAPWNS